MVSFELSSSSLTRVLGLCIYCNIILPRRLIKGAKNAALGMTVGKFKASTELTVKQSHRLTRGKPPYAMLNQH